MLTDFCRFDQIIGFNADEGNIIVIEFGLSSDPPTDQDINEGLSLDYVSRLVRDRLCTQTTPLSVGLCLDYVMDLYGLNSTDDDKERARRYTQFAGRFLYQFRLSKINTNQSPVIVQYMKGFFLPFIIGSYQENNKFIFGLIVLFMITLLAMKWEWWTCL